MSALQVAPSPLQGPLWLCWGQPPTPCGSPSLFRDTDEQWGVEGFQARKLCPVEGGLPSPSTHLSYQPRGSPDPTVFGFFWRLHQVCSSLLTQSPPPSTFPWRMKGESRCS